LTTLLEGVMSDELNQAHQQRGQADKTMGASEQGWLRSFFWRYWRGGYRLAISYWLVGWLLQFVLLFLSVIVGATLGTLARSQALTLLVITVLALAVSVWVSVGLWRSAVVYMQTSSRLWGMLAKVSALGSFVQVVVQLGAIWGKT
jgi:hypothetical protein